MESVKKDTDVTHEDQVIGILRKLKDFEQAPPETKELITWMLEKNTKDRISAVTSVLVTVLVEHDPTFQVVKYLTNTGRRMKELIKILTGEHNE